MKSLIAGVVFIILIGIGGFLYRNVQERTGGPLETACTTEAKVCPDGSSVGRSGPACEFAPCPFPNVSFPEARIALAVPPGYIVGTQEPLGDGEVEGMLGFYEKSAGEGSDHFITIYRFAIPEGKTAEDTMLEHTLLSPSGERVKDMKEFKPVLINGRAFQSIGIERFEGQVASAYYLVRDSDILRFDIREQNVEEWMNPSLVVSSLPEHKALLTMLATLELQ